MFDFNPYSGLLLPGVIQGVLFGVLLAARGFRENRLSDYLLAAILLVYALRVSNWMLGFAGWYDSHDGYSTFMFYFPFSHFLLLGPLVYFYFRSLTNHDFAFESKHLWHFLPEAVFLLRYLVVFTADVLVDHLWQGNPFPSHFGTEGLLAVNGIPVFDFLLEWGSVVSVCVYFGLTLSQFQAYRRYLNNHFSATEKLDFKWLRNLLVAVLAGYLLWLIFKGIDYFIPGCLSYISAWYSYFGWGVLIYYFSISGYFIENRQVDRLEFVPELLPAPEVAKAPVADNLDKEKAQLRQWMETGQPYLNPELTLADLAKMLNQSPGALSRTINEGLGLNFNDFVNGYRVAAVKEMMTDPGQQHLSLLGMALSCGFNSKATFNRAFLKLTGVSPSGYQKGPKVLADN